MRHNESQSLFQQMVFCNSNYWDNKACSDWESQSLFQQMVFCNKQLKEIKRLQRDASQSLFQQMVFCNQDLIGTNHSQIGVTILILVDGFLQYQQTPSTESTNRCHNPYFSRWFSAMSLDGCAERWAALSQSLFQQMVFCNTFDGIFELLVVWSQSLFQQMVFCNTKNGVIL